MKSKLTLVVAMAAACVAIQLTAMPTEEETRKAEPVVKKLLAQEQAALESGKKTRSEVAAAAMKLADEADTDAAKLLLMKGAFALYVKDGNLEKAVETMKTLEAAISDMPPQSVTNMIEMALLGVSKKVDGARLYKLLDEPKADILSHNDLPSHIESKAIAASVKERNSVASILKGMIKVPGRDYWLSATELTQGQWESVMGYNPSHHKGADLPVENVSLDDCDVFLEMLNKTKEVQASRFEFVLPMHGEWMYAAAAGCVGGWNCWIKPGVNGNILEREWVKENSSNQTHAVAQTVANAFGFYDMQGNVSEWFLSGGEKGCVIGSSISVSANDDAVDSPVRIWYSIPRDRRYDHYGLRLAAHIRSKSLSGGVGKAGSSAPESAQRQAVVDGYTWSYCVKNGEAMIVTTNGVCAVSPSPKGDVSIPSTLDGVKVTSIGNNAFRNCRGLTSVTIPSGVTSIEDHVFEGCSELKSVTIPYSVKNIGEWAFNSCFALKSVTIPPNVERIGGGAFIHCRGLTSVTIPAKVVSIGGIAFGYCSALRQINVDAGNQSFTSIDGVLYTKDQSVLLAFPNALTSVKIPKSVAHIGGWAFEGCNGLKSVTIPEGVTTIENNAFKECGGLESVVMPSGLKKIGGSAFVNCRSLKSVTIPEGVCDIGGRAFRGCGELASLTLSKGLTTIGDNAFEWCGKLTSLTLPQGLTEIGRDAFRGLGKLTSVTIPESVTSIGGAPFSYCGGLTQINVEAGNQKYTSVDGVLYTKDLTELVMCPNGLTSVTIPESMTSIGLGAFVGCSKLTSVMLPSGVSHIGEWAFEACNGLTSVTIPESVTKIDKCAFYGCGELTSLTMLGERPDAPNDIFSGCGKLKSIHVPANAKSWEGMKDWNGIPLVKSSLLKPSLLPLRGRRLLREQQRETELKAAGVESVTVKTRKDIDRLFPGWSLDSTVLNESNKDLCSGFHASHRGQNNVLYLHPANRETPVVLSRTVTLSDKNPCLFLKIASWDEGSDFLLSVRVNGKYAMPDRLVCTSDVEPWEDLVVPLFDWRGSLVKIEIVLSANNWWSERAQLARIEIAEGNGQEKYGLVGVEGKETIDGYTWSCRVRNGEVTLVAEKDGKYSCAVSPTPTGDISIPTTLGGVKVTRIGRSAFLRCGGLTSVTIPEGVTSIERDAFYDCNGLKAVTIPTSVKRIGMGAFSGCGGLISATIPEGVTHIGVLSFSRCSGLTSVVIPSGVDVARRAFSWCYGLKSATISEGVTRIGEEMFRDCIGIKSVTIPEGVTEIGVGAFMGCQELGSVTIPASVTNIEWLAFSGCKALTQINVAEGNLWFALVDGVLYTKDLTELVMCPNGLASATIQPSVKTIRGDAFRGCAKLTAVTVPANVESCSCAFTYCGALKQISVDARNPKYTSVDGVVYTKDLEELVMAPGGVESVSILAGVKRIGDGAFKGCSTLTSVTIPSGVTRILPWTFEGCSALESVTIQGNVTYIGSQAFWNCSELTSFTMRGERPYAPNNTFMGCGKLKSIHVPAKAKSWAGMKDWLGIQLVFDGEDGDRRMEAAQRQTAEKARATLEAQEKADRQREREEQRKELQRLKAELKAQRAAVEKARKARETAELEVER